MKIILQELLNDIGLAVKKITGINMASDKEFVEFLADQMEDAGFITFKKMFGEYGIYCGGRIFALICDNRLYIKPTAGGRAFIGDPVEEPPYKGAKPYFLIEEMYEDRDWLGELVRITASELPDPKPKIRKRNERGLK